MFNFERLYILCAWIGHLSQKLWPFEFLESFHCSISSVSIYHGPNTYTRVKSYRRLNLPRVSVFILECLDILCAWIGPPCERSWPFEFLASFRFSISSVSISYAPESDLRVKSYDHLHNSRASIVQFRASRYLMRLNQTSEWKVMTIWITQELPLFNSERLDMWCA